MESRTLTLLEFPKVLELVAGYAVSEAGQDACRRLTPGVELAAIEHRRQVYEQARLWFGPGVRVMDFPPLEGLFTYLEKPNALLDLDALYALKQALAQVKSLQDSLPGERDSRYEQMGLLLELVRGPGWAAKTWSALKRCLGQDGILKDESSPELMSVRSEIRRIHSTCTKKIRDFINKEGYTNFLQDDFVTISSDRFVLPLKSNFKGRFQGIIHDYSQTGETCYFEPLFLVEQNNALQELKQEEREAERQVLLFLTSLVKDEFETVHALYEVLLELDVLQAQKHFAEAYDARTLELKQDAPVSLLNAQHPLLLAPALKKKGVGSKPVPISIEFGESRRGMIISGGNAGGKTVCLKTLGVLALMARCALPLPVDEGSTLPLWSQLYVFLGDEQSLEDHVSTFTAQITNLSRVWDGISPDAMVILDEFGAGTDPSQGAALAQAVCDSILEMGAHVAMATHFPALKAYALGKEEIRAASVLFDPRTKKPIYKLGFDQVGASQALDVAREHGLPAEVLKRAEGYMLLDGSDTSALLERLNTQAVEREKELAALAKERAKLEERRAKLEERFENEKRRLFDELKSQSQDILRAWKSGKTSHKQAMKKMAALRDELAPEKKAESGPAISFESVKVGDDVRYLPWGKNGKLVEKDAKKGQLKVDINGVAMWVKISDLAACQGGGQKKSEKILVNTQQAAGSMRLDLRGQRADTAIHELAGFLDKALLRNISEVEIIHGRGTGALRREVHDFLQHFPAVHNFSLASEEHGGDGMTLVELK